MEVPVFSRYRNSEFLQYMKDVLELVNAHDVATLQLTTQHGALTTLTNQMDNLFQQEQSSGITQELVDLDNRRDAAFMGIKSTLEANEYHFDKAVQSAATSLLYNMNNYGTNIPRMNYQAETAVIDSMLSDWEAETALATAVTTLQLSTWVTELKTANEAFNDRYLARISESAANPAISFTAVREEGATAYRALVAHIEAHATLGSNAIHQSLVNEVGVLAKQYNVTVNARLSESSSVDSAPEEELNTSSEVGTES